MLEAEADETRSKDQKMQVTENNEISSIEKSTTNLDLAPDRQIRRKTWKHYILQQMEWTGSGIEPAPRCGTHPLAKTRPGT